MKTNKKSLFKVANAIKKAGKATDFSLALKKAWQAMKLQDELILGVVTFQYIKANGEIRTAKGTLKNMINETWDGLRPGCENIMAYFDVEKKGFRSFDAATLIPEYA